MFRISDLNAGSPVVQYAVGALVTAAMLTGLAMTLAETLSPDPSEITGSIGPSRPGHAPAGREPPRIHRVPGEPPLWTWIKDRIAAP